MRSDRRAFLTSFTATGAAGIVLVGCSPASALAAHAEKPGAKPGDDDEVKEKEMLGDHGFAHAVDDLARLTPTP